MIGKTVKLKNGERFLIHDKIVHNDNTWYLAEHVEDRNISLILPKSIEAIEGPTLQLCGCDPKEFDAGNLYNNPLTGLLKCSKCDYIIDTKNEVKWKT